MKAVCPRDFPPSNYWVRTGPVHYSRHVGEGHHVEGLRSQLSGAADLYQTLGSWHCFCVYDVYYAHTHHGTSQDVSQGKLIFQVASTGATLVRAREAMTCFVANFAPHPCRTVFAAAFSPDSPGAVFFSLIEAQWDPTGWLSYLVST